MMLIDQLALKSLVILIMIGIAYFSVMMIEDIWYASSDDSSHMSKCAILLLMIIVLVVDLVIILCTIALEVRLFKLVF